MVEVDVDGVLKVANELYPALAGIYDGIVDDIDESAKTMWTPNQADLGNTLELYVGTVAQFLRHSSKRLGICASTLEWVSDTLTDVDEENARCIDPQPEDTLGEGCNTAGVVRHRATREGAIATY